MSSTSTRAPAEAEVASEEYLPIEEVANRLDLPLGVLIRRVEAGDVPARRTEGPQGAQYSVRVSDLGFGAQAAVSKPKGVPSHAADEGVELLGSAMPKSWPDKVVPAPAEELAAVSGHPPAAAGAATRAADHPIAAARAGGATPVNGRAEASVSAVPIRPTDGRETGLINGTPRSEVANMVLDPRELVAGLLDRWERTLEQRIYAEQRQRFETELNSRQNLLKQMQLELQTARAEHAAAQADKDRVLAERDRQVADLQRELSTSREAGPRKRTWFSRG